MKRINWIDGLKGLAAIGVLGHHFLLAFLESTYSGNVVVAHIDEKIEYGYAQSPVSVVTNGNFFVCMFLILSGMLMYMQVKDIRDKEKLAERVAKRYFSLAFPILFTCLIVWIMMKLSAFDNNEVVSITQSSWLASYYTISDVPFLEVVRSGLFNVLFLGDTTFSTAFWMLNILFYGTFICMIEGVLYWKYEKKSILFFGVILMGTIITKNVYYSVFACAAILVEMIEFFNKKRKENNFLFIILGVVSILCGMVCGGYPTGVKPTNFYKIFFGGYKIIHIFGALCVVFGVSLLPIIAKLLEKEVLCCIGKCSMWIYLLHIPIIFSCSTRLFKGIYDLGNLYSVAMFISAMFTVLFTILLAVGAEKTIGRLIQSGIAKMLKFMEG